MLGELSRAALAAVRRRSIGDVFQDFNLIPALTAAENVALPRELDGVSPRPARALALEALEEVGIAELADPSPTTCPAASSSGSRSPARSSATAGWCSPTSRPALLDTETGKQVMRRCADVCRAVTLVAPDGDALCSSWGGTPVGGTEVLRATTGSGSPAAAATLAAGGVVVTDRRYLSAGHVELEILGAAEQRRAIQRGDEPHGRTLRLPATYLDAPGARTRAVYSPGAARKLGLDVVPGTLALHFTERLPTTDEEDAARAALSNAGIDASLSVERGYQSDYALGLLALALGAALITLGAAWIATGLAQADARDDHAMLAAIGAAPRVRKSLAAVQSLTIAGLGAALGVLAGFVPGLALIGAVESLDLVVPWLQLAAVATGVPRLAAGAAWLLTRSRLPLRSRLA